MTFRSLSLVACITMLVAGCLGDPEWRCHQETKTGACVSVLGMQPFDGAMRSSNVDVVQDLCETDDPAAPRPELFTDHDVEVTLHNAPAIANRSSPDLAPYVTFDEYEVTYVLNECGLNRLCPELSPMTFAGPTVTVRANNQSTFTLPLFPIRKKGEYHLLGGTGAEFGSYTALIDFRGRDAQGPVRLRAAAEISVGHFDNCGAGR